MGVPAFVWSVMLMHTVKVVWWFPKALVGADCPYTVLSIFYATSQGEDLDEVVPVSLPSVQRTVAAARMFVHTHIDKMATFVFVAGLIWYSESENQIYRRVGNISTG